MDATRAHRPHREEDPMGTRRRHRMAALPAVAGLVVVGLGLTGCQTVAAGANPTAEVAAAAAVVEEVSDGGPARVTLTDRAEGELGITTGTVATGPDGTTTIPFAAVVYDADGSSWAYVRVEPRTYLREPVTLTQVVGDRATLTAGPPVGTEVVTVGAAFLVGAEAGISGGE
jgi:hypothetical protein